MRRLLPLLLAGTACLAGCQFISLMVAKMSPPQKVAAKYKPPKDKTILVFVDDPFFQVTYEPLKGLLTERLSQHLTEQKVAARTVPFDHVLDLQAATPEFNRLSVAEVGRKLAADVVLYVKIDRFSLKDSEISPLWQGRLAATVRMVDAVAAERLWPTDRRDGHPVEPVELPAAEDASPQYGHVVAQTLADKMADRIAKLFYDHTIPAEQALEDRPPFTTDFPEE